MAVTDARTIKNPAIGDVVTFVETAEETGRTFVEVGLAPRSGNAPHIHVNFDEHFECVTGTLEVRVGRQKLRLAPGERAIAPAGSVHCFSNPTDASTTFRVVLEPGHTGFEQSLRIAYGLACDGQVRKGGVPRSLAHIAVLSDMSDSAPAGAFRFLGPVLRKAARRACAKGVDAELVARYCS